MSPAKIIESRTGWFVGFVDPITTVQNLDCNNTTYRITNTKNGVTVETGQSKKTLPVELVYYPDPNLEGSLCLPDGRKIIAISQREASELRDFLVEVVFRMIRNP